MLRSYLNRFKNFKIRTEGEIQVNQQKQSSSESDVKTTKLNQVNFTDCQIDSQNINIQCNSVKIIPEILQNIKILFPAANEVFTGRENNFKQLIKFLLTNHIVVVSGMAGIGKTEFAKTYAWDNHDKYEIMLWINANSEDNITISIHEIARKLFIDTDNRSITNVIHDIYEYFKQSKTTVIVVIDNANDRRSIEHIFPSIEYYVGADSEIHILVTSQNNKWGKRNGKEIPIIELGPLELKSAIQVFCLVGEDIYNSYDITLWETLSNDLNEIPLALQITAAYINNEIQTLAEFGRGKTFLLQGYIDKLQEEKHLLINEPFPDDSENRYPLTIYAAVKITLDKIKSKEQYSELAFNILYTISYLDPDYIFDDILLKFMPEEDLIKSLAVLSKFSLINGKIYRYRRRIGVYRLVQWVLRNHQKQAGNDVQNEYYLKVIQNLLNDDGWGSFHHSSILKHENHFKEIIQNFVEDTNVYVIELLIIHDCIYSLSLIFNSFELTNVDDASIWFETALSLCRLRCLKELLNYLEKKINLNEYKTSDGKLLHASLIWLKTDGNAEAIDCIRAIAEKFEVNNPDTSGYTALMIAARRGFAKIIRVFVEEFKANVTLTERNGWTAVHYLIGFTSFTNLEELSPINAGSLLLHSDVIKNLDKQGRSPLHQSARYPSPLYIDYFIKQNLDVNLKDKLGNAPLILCFEHTMQQSLLNLSSCFLKKEIHLIETIDLLVKNHADINAVNKNGKTILHLASRNYPLVVAHLITAHNFNVNIKDNDNQTALYDVSDSALQTAKLLLDRGAKANEMDKNEFTAITWAEKKGLKK